MFNELGQINWKYIFLIIVIVLFLYFLLTYLSKKRIKEPFTQNNNQQNQQNKTKIILYYSDGCGWCQKFMPEWTRFEQIAKQKLNSLNLQVIKISCDKNQNTCQIENIQGYPTVILYKNNKKITEFSDERTAEKLIEFINNHT